MAWREAVLDTCDWKQFLEGKQRAQVRNHSVASIPVSDVGMAEDADHASLGNALFELTSGVWIERGRVQAYNMPSVGVG